MISPQLTARSLATLRGRFEALRGFGPIPVLMAEVPANYDPGFRLCGGFPVPPVRHLYRHEPRYLAGGVVLTADRQGDPLLAPVRHLWVACSPRVLERLRQAFEAAAGFARAARTAASIAVESGAGSASEEWLWALFEVAAKNLPFSPLRLRGGHVTVASGVTHFPAHQVAAARARPDRQDLLAKMVRACDPAPTLYWEVGDVVEASLMLLDLTEEAPPAVIEQGDGGEGGRAKSRKTGGRPHKRSVDGLDVNQWVSAMLAKDPSFRHLSQREAEKRGPFGARTIGQCRIWNQMKDILAEQAKEEADRAKAELEDRWREDGAECAGGVRHSSTKHGVGRQRTTIEDREHERKVKSFIDSKEAKPKKTRPK